jgi:hypothetical protein
MRVVTLSFDDGCLDVFANELDGFDARRAVFAFPYNASTPELEAWLPEDVRAFRTAGDPIMPLPRPGQTKVLCTGSGPEALRRASPRSRRGAALA